MAAPYKSPDNFPLGTIKLSEAFQLFYRATTPNWQQLDTVAAEDDFIRYDEARARADKLFRDWLATGDGPHARIRDPDNSSVLELDHQEWAGKTGLMPGFDDDYVWEDDLFQPGPAGAFYKGALRPVFFDKAEFRAAIAQYPAAHPADQECGGPDHRAERARKIPENRPNGKKAGMAWSAALRIDDWKQYGIPDDLPIAAICQKVSERMPLRSDGAQGRVEVAQTTILRALGLAQD